MTTPKDSSAITLFHSLPESAWTTLADLSKEILTTFTPKCSDYLQNPTVEDAIPYQLGRKYTATDFRAEFGFESRQRDRKELQEYINRYHENVLSFDKALVASYYNLPSYSPPRQSLDEIGIQTMTRGTGLVRLINKEGTKYTITNPLNALDLERTGWTSLEAISASQLCPACKGKISTNDEDCWHCEGEGVDPEFV
jgi:hypothetical protein